MRAGHPGYAEDGIPLSQRHSVIRRKHQPGVAIDEWPDTFVKVILSTEIRTVPINPHEKSMSVVALPFIISLNLYTRSGRGARALLELVEM